MLNANLLKAAIVRAGLTQQDFAKAIGISQNTLTSKLKGDRSFNLDEIDKTCEVLDIIENDEKCAIFLSSTSLNRDNG
jgi:transcriptional regulator with XRE-family HTH domain